MTGPGQTAPRIAIACGGTGGHLFPGLAVAEQLRQHGCAVTLLVSSKEVDQQALAANLSLEVVSLPAVGLTRGRALSFLRGLVRAYGVARQSFHERPPQAVLGMGGFTAVPAMLAARRLGARLFLHESNTIPGRANRWLSWLVDYAFVGFPSAAARLHARKVTATGTPVRSQFQPRDPGPCRRALGLDPIRSVVLVMGGSQGARGINAIVESALPSLANLAPAWQWFHLTGPADAEKLRRLYGVLRLRAVVHPFFSEMELALGAATAAISRAGASSLAELAAVRLPAVLIPYPAAIDAHQLRNARAFARTGAARLLEQSRATPDGLARLLTELMDVAATRQQIQGALAQWHAPRAAEQIARFILAGSSCGGPPGVRHSPEDTSGTAPTGLRGASPGSLDPCLTGSPADAAPALLRGARPGSHADCTLAQPDRGAVTIPRASGSR